MKKQLLLLLSFVVSGMFAPVYLYAGEKKGNAPHYGISVAVKTNLYSLTGFTPDFEYATVMPNLEAELFFSDRWSISVSGAVEYAKELGCKHPEIVLHLDHGDTFETCKSCIDSGFSSVMIDGSHLPYEENVALTKKVVEYAHQFDVTVEGELGVLAGVEDEVSAEHHTYTNPEEVIDFATRTGCDSLAISIGTSHGAYKFKPEQCHIDPATGRLVPPPLEFAVLDAVMEKLPGFPIVLHGSSSVPQEEVDTINQFGGKLEAAIGIPEDQLRKAAKSAVCKINIDSDSRLAMTAAVRKVFAEKPAEFDPRKYLGPARDNMEKLYKHKIINVLGSENKLAQLD